MKRMKLNELKLKSFVTRMDVNISKTAKGGAETDLQDTNCSAVDKCPSGRGCTVVSPC
ncbi:MAG: pinensin family lanthipeptide [Cyclobacteriaceae bacterium]